MSTGLFILANLAVVVVIAYLIYSANKKVEPSGFKLDSLNGKKPVTYKGIDGSLRGEVVHEDKRSEEEKKLDEAMEKSLNCWFQYNGHSWDAFDALGVPGGADQKTCERAFQKLVRNPEKAEFAQLAWKALEERFKKSG